MICEPIGTFHCSKSHPYEAARQGSLDPQASGYIELNPGKSFEQALEGLEKFSHLWIVFEFHWNKSWKPKVSPPRGSEQKVGVFASRSPYRPNPIGMSCVRLKKISGLKIEIEAHDLLDQSPILDIKPYLPYADSFPEATLGWIQSKPLSILWSEKSKLQLQHLKAEGVSEIQSFAENQLSENPTDHKKKRVSKDAGDNDYVLSYRTWRILFSLNLDQVFIHELQSGYSQSDLNNEEDIYRDKKIHKNFVAQIQI